MPHEVLIVEDDPEIAQLVQLHLHDIDCRGTIAPAGKPALRLCEQRRFDLLILDLMLPDMDGLKVCRQLRERSDYLPILMLTAKNSELDRVMGLELGADDYLPKPFSFAELQARVKALLRRVAALSQQAPVAAIIQHGELVIDTDKRQVRVGAEMLDLTAKEFDLLVQFARHPGRVFSRQQLLDAVWGYGHDGYEHTVNSHINRLRAKLEQDPAEPRFILTVWGVGYKFAEAGSVST